MAQISFTGRAGKDPALTFTADAPGTIDAGYRGEVGVVLINHGRDPHIVRRGDRIAQLLVQRVERPQVVEAADLGNTTRGPSGFGSTGN